MQKAKRTIRILGKSKYISLRKFKVGDVLDIRKIEEIKEEVN